ncbi:unnamed protein product [Calypogeia fissa]
MASARLKLCELNSTPASSVVGFQTVALVLLLFVLISAANCAGDGRGRGWNDGALAVNRRNGVANFPESQGLGPRFGRGLLQNGGTNISTMHERPLAVKRDRYDPFKDFHKYRGGYDVKSKHYWGSLVWTGLPGYAIAVAWLVLGILFLLSVCCAQCWCRRNRLTHPAASPRNVLSLWVIIFIAALLTMAAIGGCVVLFIGTREFAVEARKVEHSFKDAAANATGTMDGLTGAIVEVEQILQPFSGNASIITGGISLQTLNSTQETLSRESENINHTVHKNTHTLDKIITALETALMILAGLNLILIIVGPVFVLLHWRCSFYLIVTTAWVLTTLTIILFGVSFALDNLVKDTCDAMNEYKADPYNTTLDALLPCQDLMSASGALADIGQSIRNSITQVNTTIIQYEGQLSKSLPVLCEQIGPAPSYQYMSTCPAGTIPISELPQDLQIFKCATNDTKTCSQQGTPLTDFQYKEVVAFSKGAQTLLNVCPSIGELTNCSIVVQTFSKLLDRNCGPTKAAALLVWDAFIILTISLVLLILWWLVLTCGNRERKEQIFPVIGSPVKNKVEN